MYGCLGTRYLKDDEKQLFKQNIKAGKPVNTDALEELYSQRPNRKFALLPITPYVSFYYLGLKKYDSVALEKEKLEIAAHYDTLIAHNGDNAKKVNKLINKKNRKIAKINTTLKEGNVLMRWGEPISVYDSALTEQTVKQFQLYLFAKGYFNADISYENKFINRQVISTFTIDEKQHHTIDTILLKIPDSAIREMLTKRESLITPGMQYDQDIISDERDDINNYMKNRGYYNFSKQYVSFAVDTTYGDHSIAVQYIIKNPSNADEHQQFTVDQVNFITDANVVNLPDSLRETIVYNKVKYKAFEQLYKPKILSRRLFIHPDSLYSRANTFDTQTQLANLDNFKFININYDSTGGTFIANIFTRPLPRYQWTNEFGVNVTQGFPGPFYNTTFKKRNIFQGLENFEISGRIGIEGVATAAQEDIYRSIETGIHASITFPKFILPIREKSRERFGHKNPKTILSTGYSHTNRPEYIRNTVNYATTFSWQSKTNTLYNLSVTDISVIDSDITDSLFNARLLNLEQNGSNLINSFKPSFVSSMIFRVGKNFNNYGTGKNRSAYLRLLAESGGTVQNFTSTKFYEERGWETYKYVKFNIDYRKTRPLNNSSAIAYRVNAGVAVPYGSEGVLPYEKYFFAGGSNGIRGWRPRRLGPGSYTPQDSLGNITYAFEQQGELLMEASIELRKNLFGFVDWAYFIDVGNIWTLKNDNNRPGSQFELDRFYEEIAIASGLGIRLDFSFLIIRLDAGLKIYDPARPKDKRFIFSSGFNDAPFDNVRNTEPLILNIGIGYPF